MASTLGISPPRWGGEDGTCGGKDGTCGGISSGYEGEVPMNGRWSYIILPTHRTGCD